MSTTIEAIPGSVTEEPAAEERTAPSDYEYSTVLDGEMRFLSCTHCGALVAADAASITRHTESHRRARPEPQAVENGTPTPERHAGSDLAELIRGAARATMQDQGVSQVELAKRVGASQKHLSQMFTGAAVGSLELWSKIATALDRRWSVSLVEDE